MEHTNLNRKPKRFPRLFAPPDGASLQTPLLLQGAEYGIRFLLGAVLACGQMLNGCIPFGLGFVGAAGPGLSGLFSLLGCCAGYAVSLSLAAAMKYIAASILVFAVSFAFFDVRFYQTNWFLPLFTSGLTAATGFVYLPEQGLSVATFVVFFTEILLAGACTYFYKIAFSIWQEPGEGIRSRRQLIALLLLCISLLIPLSQVSLPGGISVGRLAGAFLVMLSALYGGLGRGSAVGIAIGLALDLAAGGTPFCTMAYGLSGLMAGAAAVRSRFASVCAYVLANGAAVLWALGGGAPVSLLYEVFIASIFFLIVPERLLFRLNSLLQAADPSEMTEEMPPSHSYVKEQLEAAATAFRELYEGIRSSFQPHKSNGHDVAVLFDRAAARACRNCPLYAACWERNYHATLQALDAAAQKMLARGRAEHSDFPPAFSKRCMRFPALLAAVNEELTAMLYRKQYRSRLMESRMAVCRQYQDLAGILNQTAARLDQPVCTNPQRARKLHQFLQEWELDARCNVFHEPSGHLRVEIEGPELSLLEEDEMQTKISQLVEVPLRPPRRTEEGEGERVVFTELEPLAAVIGVAARRRENEDISGDNGAYFKTEDGTLHLILADGMGSGEAAAQESNLAIHLLERFLRAGIRPEPALKTLNSALILRCDTDGGFTTLDLLQVNLFTGQTDLYKFGAAPSYYCQNQHVRRISGTTMPAGLSTGGVPAPDVCQLHVDASDLLVLISDGILGGGEDQWLRDLIAQHKLTDPPRKLARFIVEQSEERIGRSDDKTAMVLAVETRKKPE